MSEQTHPVMIFPYFTSAWFHSLPTHSCISSRECYIPTQSHASYIPSDSYKQYKLIPPCFACMDHSCQHLFIHPLPIIQLAVAPHCNCGTGKCILYFLLYFPVPCLVQISERQKKDDVIQSFEDAVIRNETLLQIPAFCGGSQPPSFLRSLRCLLSARWAGLASLPKAFGKAHASFLLRAPLPSMCQSEVKDLIDICLLSHFGILTT